MWRQLIMPPDLHSIVPAKTNDRNIQSITTSQILQACLWLLNINTLGCLPNTSAIGIWPRKSHICTIMHTWMLLWRNDIDNNFMVKGATEQNVMSLDHFVQLW